MTSIPANSLHEMSNIALLIQYIDDKFDKFSDEQKQSMKHVLASLEGLQMQLQQCIRGIALLNIQNKQLVVSLRSLVKRINDNKTTAGSGVDTPGADSEATRK